MKAFYIAGGNGTYIELEDGRFADTVIGDTSESVDAHDAIALLDAVVTDWVSKDKWARWSNYENSVMDIEDYVAV